jgi:hypothetical protein
LLVKTHDFGNTGAGGQLYGVDKVVCATVLEQTPSNVPSFDSLDRLIEVKIYDGSGHLQRDQHWSYFQTTQQVYEWNDFNYQTTGSLSAEVIVYYSQGGTIRSAPWLSWMGVQAPTGSIIHAESWNFTSTDYIWERQYDHEVRAFWNNQWVVQNHQGNIGDCVVIAGLDALEAVTGQHWDTGQAISLAEANGWLGPLPGGGMYLSDLAKLYAAMGGQVHTSDTYPSTLSSLLSSVSAGKQVVVGLDLAYISAFTQSGMHAVVFHGEEIVNGVKYVDITNGWNIQSMTTQTTGYDPRYAYPITRIPENEFLSAWQHAGSEMFNVYA